MVFSLNVFYGFDGGYCTIELPRTKRWAAGTLEMMKATANVASNINTVSFAISRGAGIKLIAACLNSRVHIVKHNFILL